MWKAAAGTNVQQLNAGHQDNDDDWETDPDFINDVSEQEQRWGAATVVGSGRTAGAIDMEKLRKETEAADADKKKKDLEDGPNASFGYGGKFGVEKDRMDKSALGHDHIEKLQMHASQKDYATGFGGKFGIQTDRVDKSALSWDHKEKVEKHTSQKDYVSGFGGKFGVQSDRQDKSAVGWDHVEKVDKHESQKDYSKGFGGKFGVQTDRQDKSAVGWDHHEAPQKHESQTDHKVGFGGKFGVQTDRMDKSAESFESAPHKISTNYDRVKPDIAGAKPSDLRAKFESMNAQDGSRASSHTSSPTPRKIHAKAAAFATAGLVAKEEPIERTTPKQLDQSKTAFLQQTQQESSAAAVASGDRQPGQLNKSKFSQFNKTQSQIITSNSASKVAEEIQQLRQNVSAHHEPEPQQPVECVKVNVESAQDSREIYDEVPNVDDDEEEMQRREFEANEATAAAAAAVAESVAVPEELQEEEIVDTGYSAIALYDYQAAADDEVSFDPDDVITHVEMIDEGWWRGLCKGRYGLFPANYVQLQE